MTETFGFSFAAEEKWKAGSCLQKAIRRGRADIAMSVAFGLWDLDAAWLLHRMSVMAVEDVGLGNPDLACDWLSLPGGKRAFSAAGGKELLVDFAERFAKSVKDRSACDLSSLVELGAQDYGSVILDSFNDIGFLREVVESPDSTVREKVLAGWGLAGTKRFPGAGLPENTDGDWEMFLSSWGKAGVSENSLKLAELGMKKMREFHPVSIPMCALSLSQTSGVKKDFNLEHERLLPDGKTLPSALDWHVSEGKRALSKALASSKPLQKVFHGDSAELKFAKCLFRDEGGAIDIGLSYGLSDFLYDMTRESLASWVGHEWSEISSALSLAKKDIALKRSVSVSNTPLPRPK